VNNYIFNVESVFDRKLIENYITYIKQ